VTRPANTTFDVVALFTLYTVAQGATALLIRLFSLGGLLFWTVHFFAIYIAACLFPGGARAAWLTLGNDRGGADCSVMARPWRMACVAGALGWRVEVVAWRRRAVRRSRPSPSSIRD
jgi:hypothetical protein